MKETMKYAMAIAITAAAMFAYMYEPPPERVVQEVAHQTTSDTTIAAQTAVPLQLATQTESQERELTAAELADIDPASIDWAEVRKSRGAKDHFDPMIRSDLFGFLDSFDFSDVEIAAYNALHVVPFNPATEKICTPTSKGAGSADSSVDGVVIECVFERAYAEPLEFVPNDELANLAKSDALAAAVLARRSDTEESRFMWTAQAIALSGKSGPALWMAEHNFISTRLVHPIREDRPLYDNILKRYSLERIAFDLGDPRANPEKYLALIDEAFGKNSRGAIEYANSQTQIFKERITEIRQQASLPLNLWEEDRV